MRNALCVCVFVLQLTRLTTAGGPMGRGGRSEGGGAGRDTGPFRWKGEGRMGERREGCVAE